MMLAGNLPISSEMPGEALITLYAFYVDHAPTRNASAAFAAHLPTEQSDNSILNAVIVRLGDPFIIFINKPDQLLIFNRTAKHPVQL